ncbi:MAG: DNA recombination protein RmuC [Gammaproteobacteria bacterium]|nr:DNA recombination protein RmuC [Gammaproteobacteria bacterium]
MESLYYTFILVFSVAMLIGMAVGALVVTLRNQKANVAQRDELVMLRTTLENERNSYQQKAAAIEQVQQQLTNTFTALSSQALSRNNEEFLRLAAENLKQLHIQAQGDLGKREQAIEAMIKPIREALNKTEQQMTHIEKDRKEAYGALHKQLESMSLSQQALRDETRNLVQALRRPEIRGQWGELTLRRLVELAGMLEHCDFVTQESVRNEEQTLRPDMIIRLPGNRQIIVDVKTPLDAYLSAIEAKDDITRTAELQHHARKVRERVRELAAKSYWKQFSNTPDFVILFIPGDQFLAAALDIDRALLEDALQMRVILATPTSLVALLRAIAYGWRQESLAENAEQLRVVGEDLFQRLGTFAEHLGKIGRSLETSVTHYNNAVASFDSRLLPSGRRFVEMGLQAKRPLERIEPITQQPRAIVVEESATDAS